MGSSAPPHDGRDARLAAATRRPDRHDEETRQWLGGLVRGPNRKATSTKEARDALATHEPDDAVGRPPDSASGDRRYPGAAELLTRADTHAFRPLRRPPWPAGDDRG